MRRRSRLVALPLLGLLGLLVLAGPVSADGETKTFSEHNFKLTSPAGWQWIEVGDADRQNGFVARLGRRAAGTVAIANVRVAPTNGLPVRDLTREVQAWLEGNLPSRQGSRIEAGKLSGLEGTALTIKGQNANDQPVLIKVYSIESGGKHHQLFVEFQDGAEEHLAGEAENLRRSYRLLEGAGPEEELVDPGSFEGGAGDLEGGSQMPQGGPEKDGNTLKFDDLNFRWNVPEKSPYEIDDVTNDASTIPTGDDARRLISFRMAEERGGESGGQNVGVVVLIVAAAEGKPLPGDAVAQGGLHESLGKRYFDRVDYGRMKTEKEVAVGNFKGAYVEMTGAKKNEQDPQKQGDVVTLRLYFVRLGDLWYEFMTVIRGNRAASTKFAAPRDALMAGLEFLETQEAAIGPVGVLGVAPSSKADRAEKYGEEKSITSVGFKAKKPKFMGLIDVDTNRDPNLRLAWEMRSEDKQQYLYMDVQSFPYNPGARDPEKQLIGTREGQWLQVVQGPQTKNMGGDLHDKGKWSKAKGLEYEFTGSFNDKPVTEMGWVVRYKKYIYWIRIQLVGEDAKSTFKKEVKKLQRALKF